MFINEREKRERERNINWLPPVWALIGVQTHNLGVCSDEELNLQPIGACDDVPTN